MSGVPLAIGAVVKVIDEQISGEANRCILQLMINFFNGAEIGKYN
jgi:hypothetical protein